MHLYLFPIHLADDLFSIDVHAERLLGTGRVPSTAWHLVPGLLQQVFVPKTLVLRQWSANEPGFSANFQFQREFAPSSDLGKVVMPGQMQWTKRTCRTFMADVESTWSSVPDSAVLET